MLPPVPPAVGSALPLYAEPWWLLPVLPTTGAARSAGSWRYLQRFHDVTVDDTSEHEHATTDNTVVRDEKPAELVGNLVERGLEVRDTVEGLCSFGASSFRPRPSTVSKESRRKAKRSIIGRAVMSDAAKVASRGTYTSTLNELMYRNWSSIGGVIYTVPRSTLCNSATAMSTFTKFTHARITQCFFA